MQTRTKFSVGLGENLREALHDKGIGSMRAGVELGITQISVQRHLRGDVVPSAEQLMHYAQLLEVPVDDLLPRLDSNQEPAGSGIAA